MMAAQASIPSQAFGFFFKWRSVIFFVRQHPWIYLTLAIIVVASAVLETMSAAALFPLMNAILQVNPGEGRGKTLDFLFSLVMFVPIKDPVYAATALLAVVITLKSAVTILREHLIARGGEKVVYGAKLEIFKRYASAPYHYFVERRQADLSYALTTAPQSLGFLLLLLPSSLAQGLVIIALCVLLAALNWKLAVVLILLGLGLSQVLRLISQKVSYMAGQRRAAARANELGIITEFLTGVKEVIVAGNTGLWSRRYAEESNELRRVNTKDHTWQMIPGAVTEFIFFILMGLGLAVYQYVQGIAAVAAFPMLVVYAYALYRLVGAVSTISYYRLKISSYLPEVERLYYLLNESLLVTEEGVETNLVFMDTLVIDNVSFVYPNRSEYALRSVSLAIPKGRATALVGRSGAGKTTLVNILLRLYEPTKGVIRVDGRELKDYRRESWLRHVGYVSQEVFILNGSLTDNIRFGLNQCTQEDVETAAKASFAHEFIINLPQGYSTVVGDRGMTLSGGQRQRIAIARALLRKPEILIFDEATSALDNISETLIQQAITELSRNHTLILVAHRLSTVRMADQIVVLDRGRIVETGNHEELLARKGQYSLMVAAAE